MNRLFACTVLLFVASPAIAADANGYTAQYECRGGNPNCDVDVMSLAEQACQQIVAISTPWNKINWSNDVICIEEGDHTSKGPLIINASGTAGKRKVLRYYNAVNDNGEDPWRQASQARLSQIQIVGAQYWIIHRLTIDAGYKNGSVGIYFKEGSNAGNNVISNVLVEHAFIGVAVFESDNNVIQYSLIRDGTMNVNVDSDGISIGYNSKNTFVINNEIYKVHSHGIYIGPYTESSGTVIENNDIYADPAQWTDCAGNYTPKNPDSPCSDAEAAVSFKSGGSTASPIRVIHNRMWGLRHTDLNVCCQSGSQGQLFSISEEGGSAASFVLAQNNILSDAQLGFQSPREGSHNNSMIGNLVYRIKDYRAGTGSSPFNGLGHFDNNEIYLNTVIAATDGATSTGGWANIGSGNQNLDVRCNVVISSASRTGDTPDAGTTVDWNAFYDTAKFTANGVDSNISNTVITRTGSTAYAMGAILRTATMENCLTQSDTGCFLYRVTMAGKSAPGTVSYCNTLGCTTQDGDVIVQAIRGPYVYRRKLRTIAGGEPVVVPYALAHSSAPESRGCDPAIGRKPGVGIGDLLP